MSYKPYNEPAFPVRGACAENQFNGMTLRDYFMAHAPAEPQPWFQPVMPPAPRVMKVHEIEDRQIRDEVLTADDAGADPETDAGMEFVRQRSEAQAQFDQWEAERRKQRYIQWPAAWADAMLDQRGGA